MGLENNEILKDKPSAFTLHFPIHEREKEISNAENVNWREVMKSVEED